MDSVGNWGVFLDSQLLLEKQMVAMAGRPLHIFVLVPIVPRLQDVFMVTYILDTFLLDYCNAFCMELSLKTIQKLQLVQNIAS